MTHVIGDSHVEVFKSIEGNYKITCIRGATVTGLTNPNRKKSDKNPILKQILEKCIKDVSSNEYIFFHLGEVDCGFAIWWYAEKKGISIKKQLDIAISNYEYLIQYAKRVVGNKIVIISTVLPTITDSAKHKVANQRRAVKASMLERTKLTLEFNKRLKGLAYNNNVIFMDLDKYLLNKDTMVIKDEYRNSNEEDHHLDNQKFSELLKHEINNLINKK